VSYKVEHFKGNWYDEGYVFATRDEAKAYSYHLGIIPSRVVEATRESTMQAGVLANVAVNYTFKDGQLKPYKVLSKGSMSWEEYMLAGGHGMPVSLPSVLDQACIDWMLKQISEYTVPREYALAGRRYSEALAKPMRATPKRDDYWSLE